MVKVPMVIILKEVGLNFRLFLPVSFSPLDFYQTACFAHVVENAQGLAGSGFPGIGLVRTGYGLVAPRPRLVILP